MTNYKHQYEQMKLMVDKYQNEIVPGLRKLLAEREPVRRGRWVKDENGRTVCDQCKENPLSPVSEHWNTKPLNYCPNCGAKMDGDDDATN